MEALDAARQAAWEVQAVNRAVVRFRAIAKVMDPTALPAGQRVLAETVRPVAAAVRRLQEEVVALQGKGTTAPWHAPFLAVEPDVLAVVGVATALRGAEGGQILSVFSRRVADAVRDQMYHDRFVSEQSRAERKAKKAAKETGDDPMRVREGELLRVWKARHPEADRFAWRRFSKRVGLARSEPWNPNVIRAVGAAVAKALVDGAPEWFSLAHVGQGVRKALSLLLSPHAVEQMADTTTRAEVARPLLLPMIVPPNPWRYVEKEAA